jgi:hypothetical protein
VSVSFLLVVQHLPTDEEIAAAAAAVELSAARAGALAFRGAGSAQSVEVETFEEGGDAVVAVRTAEGRSAADRRHQARLAVELLDRLGGAVAPGERVTADELRALARSAPPAVPPARSWARRNLRALGALGALVFAAVGLVALLTGTAGGSRAALGLFAAAAVSSLLALAERRARPRS